MPFDFIATVSNGNYRDGFLTAFKFACGSYAAITPAPTPFTGSTDQFGQASAISPNDQYVAVGSIYEPDLVDIFQRSGSTYPLLTTLDSSIGGYAIQMQFSPDGNYLLVGGFTNFGSFKLYSTNNFTAQTNTGLPPFINTNNSHWIDQYSANGTFLFIWGNPNAWQYSSDLLIYLNNGSTATWAGGILTWGNSSYTLASPITITGISNANPGMVTTATPHGLSNGNMVYINNVNGMTQVDDNMYYVANAGAGVSTTFTLLDGQTGNPVDTSNTFVYSPYSSGGSVFNLVNQPSATGGGSNYLISPNGNYVISAGGCCPDKSQLWTVNGSGAPTLVSPSPFDPNDGFDTGVWLSDSTVALHYGGSWGTSFGVDQINSTNPPTITNIGGGGASNQCAPSGNILPGIISFNKSTIVLECNNQDNYQVWNVSGTYNHASAASQPACRIQRLWFMFPVIPQPITSAHS
jgi:hypothetical protein